MTCDYCSQLQARVAELESYLGYGRKTSIEADRLMYAYHLTGTESRLLLEMWRARGRPVQAWALGQKLTADSDMSDVTVKVHVYKIRQKLPRPDFIETFRNVGYGLTPEAVSALDEVLNRRVAA